MASRCHPLVWLLLTRSVSVLALVCCVRLMCVVYLDEGVREASDRDAPGQMGLAHVGGPSVLQLSLTSE